MSAFAALAALLAGYLAGSFPTGPLLAGRRGVDLRALGSGNIGATNAARALGWRVGALVLAGDALKGALPVALALTLAPASLAPEAAAVGAVLGHLFPFTLGFRGGKGVATAFGGFLPLAPLAALAALAIWGLLLLLTRKSSLGSLVAAALFGPLVYALSPRPLASAAALGVVALVFWRHRENLDRLRRGEEHQI